MEYYYILETKVAFKTKSSYFSLSQLFSSEWILSLSETKPHFFLNVPYLLFVFCY